MGEQENQHPELQMSAHEVEKLEEEKLKAKYATGIGGSNVGRPIGGHSAFLQKRLAKGQKFFDSGDYQMAKQKMGGINKPPLKVAGPVNPYTTGEAIPTPETVPARKTSIIQPSKFTSNIKLVKMANVGPKPLVLCGPSGSGKSTLLNKLLKDFPDKFGFSVSHTTRSPRPGEVDGVHYHFITLNTMLKDVEEGKFIESAVFGGNMYGTSKKAVSLVRSAGKVCILDIDVQGVKNVKKTTLSPWYVFIKPPSLQELEERLRKRNTESEESLLTRLQVATEEIKYELVKMANVGPKPLVLCGPSGSGKSTLLNKLLKDFPDKFGFSVSHTTRSPRPGEVDGVHYHFITLNTMLKDVEEGKFIESAVFGGNMYGTSKKAVSLVRSAGKVCILDIDVQGVKNVKKTTLSPWYVFIKPPSLQELEERLRKRNTESEESLLTRLQVATEEIKYAEEPENFDFVVVNDDLELAYNRLKTFVVTNVILINNEHNE
ncbi:hypothetical protein FQA39_LY00214 [Lamprigera yunnana]|nr:hypothetical protein FQA39_LY00214 [Lamprigera yunnana]